MARITSSWSLIKEAYCGWDGYHDVYWRMYARISAQSGNSTTVAVEGRLYISGNYGSFSSWTTTTSGGNVGNYSAWGVDAGGTYYVGETTLWSGSDTTTGTSMGAGVRFYSSPWGWTGENLYISDTLTFEPAVSAPSGLSVSIAEVYTNGAKFNVSLDSYGTPSSVNGRYIEAAILNQNTYGAPYKYEIASNTKTAAITVTNSSPRGSLNIQPNKQYYYGGYASNTALPTKTVSDKFVTKAQAPTVTFVSSTATSATFSYSVSADGGHYDRTIQYSLDGGTTWRDGPAITGSSAKSGSFTVNGLLSGATYTMQTRISTTAGITSGESVAFDILVGEADNRNVFYGPVNGKTKEIQTFYGSVNDEARPITRLYGAAPDYDLILGTISPYSQAVIGFDAETFKAKLIADDPGIWADRYTLVNLIVTGMPNTPTRKYKLDFLYRNGWDIFLFGDASMLNSFGIYVNGLIPADYRQTIDYIAMSPQIVTKLIHQGFGHVDYS